MRNPFTNHPNEVGETYFQHFCYAIKSGSIMVTAGLISIIHGVFPFLFKTTGSDFILKLIQKYVERMPVVDQRIIRLSQSIKRRMDNHKMAS
jgi:hypothetical protein